MKPCTANFCPIHHIAIDVADLEGYVRFFREVFGMSVTRTKGPAERPDSVWLDGGVQLDRVAEPSRENGRFSHLSFQTTDVPGTVAKALAHGAAPVPGKGAHWFMLPDGLRFEMKE